MNPSHLLAIRVTRRAIAIVGFEDEQLNFLKVHQISSTPATAEDSALGFVRRFAALLEIDSAAVELVHRDEQTRRVMLTSKVVAALRDDGIPVRECAKQELFDAFADPPLKTRKELRTIVNSFWPSLEQIREGTLLADAAALGLYVQVQRLFTP